MLRSTVIFVMCASFAAVSSAAAQTRLSGSSVVAPPAASAKPAAKKIPARAPKPFADLMARGSNPNGPFARVSSVQRDSIVARARSLIGVKYVWAGLNPELGLDCSGIVKYLFAKLGIELPHHAADIATLGHAVPKDTTRMLPGDLLVFGIGPAISHVGIYVGGGMMIHASSGFKKVVEVPLAAFRPTNGLRWKGVRRVIAVDTARFETDTAGPSR